MHFSSHQLPDKTQWEIVKVLLYHNTDGWYHVERLIITNKAGVLSHNKDPSIPGWSCVTLVSDQMLLTSDYHLLRYINFPSLMLDYYVQLENLLHLITSPILYSYMILWLFKQWLNTIKFSENMLPQIIEVADNRIFSVPRILQPV